MRSSVGQLVGHLELKSRKTRISAPAHPSATDGRVSGLVSSVIVRSESLQHHHFDHISGLVSFSPLSLSDQSPYSITTLVIYLALFLFFSSIIVRSESLQRHHFGHISGLVSFFFRSESLQRHHFGHIYGLVSFFSSIIVRSESLQRHDFDRRQFEIDSTA